ncbi:MAG: hypothetical protein ACRD0H_06895 [Actinomycetes bacterium]
MTWYVHSLANDPVRHRGTVARGQIDTACTMRFPTTFAVRLDDRAAASSAFPACPDCPQAVEGGADLEPTDTLPDDLRRALRRAWTAARRLSGQASALVSRIPDPLGVTVLAGVTVLVLVLGWLTLGAPQ